MATSTLDSDWMVLYLDHVWSNCLLLGCSPSTGNATQYDNKREIKQTNCLNKSRGWSKNNFQQHTIIKDVLRNEKKKHYNYAVIVSWNGASIIWTHPMQAMNVHITMDFAACMQCSNQFSENLFSLFQPCQLKLCQILIFYCFYCIIELFWLFLKHARHAP